MHDDAQLALCLELDVLGQLAQRDGVRIADRVARGHVPLGLGDGRQGCGQKCAADSRGKESHCDVLQWVGCAGAAEAEHSD